MDLAKAFYYRHEADLAASYLKAHGVEAVVVADDCGAVDPALGFGRQVQVLVPSEMVDKARALLATSSRQRRQLKSS